MELENMMTSSNGHIFRVTGSLCGEFTGHRIFSSQRPVTRCFDVFIDLCLNKRLSRQLWGWWCETPPCSLWRHCNVWGLVETIMVVISISYHESNKDRYITYIYHAQKHATSMGCVYQLKYTTTGWGNALKKIGFIPIHSNILIHYKNYIHVIDNI